MALQLTGAFKKHALANLQVRAAGGRHRRRPDGDRHGHGAARLLPAPGREDARPLRGPRAEQGEERRPRHVRRRRSGRSSTGFSRTAARSASERERAARGRRSARTSRGSAASGAASRSSTADAMEDSPAYRLNHEEIIKALEEGISFVESLEPHEAVPDELGKLQAMRFRAERSGETVELPARTVPRRRRHDAEHHVREGAPGRLPARREATLLRSRTAPSPGRRASELEPAHAERRERVLHVATQRDGKFVTFYGDNHPATPATSSRRWPRRATDTARSSRLLRTRACAPRRAADIRARTRFAGSRSARRR